MIKAGIVSVGCSNIQSVFQALNYCGFRSIVIEKHSDFSKVDILVLPGVGSFNQSMKKLLEKNFLNEILIFNEKKKYIFGICLGMQLMMSEGSEGGNADGLNFIKGNVKLLNYDGKINLGWKKIKDQKKLFYKECVNEYFYFMHIYGCQLVNNDDKLFLTDNFNDKFCSGFKKDNIIGVQFHPEKSGENGILFLKKLYNIIKYNK